MEKQKNKENNVFKSTLLNIDSSYRNITPKNICTSDGKTLPSDPFALTQNSNTVTITYPNHNFAPGDIIVIQNVVGINKTLANYFFLVNNFAYYIIVFGDININSNYTLPLYSMIEIVGSMTETNVINNILFNYIPGYKQTFLYSDIPQLNINTAQSGINSLITNLTGYTAQVDINNYLQNNCLFVLLPTTYINSNANYYAVNQVFKVSYNHMGGIPLGYFNSNFPISNINYQSNIIVTNVLDSNRFTITLNYKSYMNMSGGGNIVQIMKIINSITGYPNANNYVINLKKSFNNVTKIELVSSEFPYIDVIIEKNINDKLYWKHIEDGNHIYSVSIDEGFYTSNTLLSKLMTLMNNVPRITSTNINTIYNNFDIMLETNTQKITFKPYIILNNPNCLSINIELINNISYYILNITQSNNYIKIGDSVIINGATNTTYTNNNIYYSIDSSYINKTFTVYSINLQTSTYSVILGLQTSIPTTIVNNILNGGGNIILKLQTKVSFLFNYSDTIGYILGFLNVGYPTSIIDYNSVITNSTPYINSNNVNTAGNILTYSNNFINLSGNYNYMLMYLNNLEYIYVNNSLPSPFAKILLNGNPGDILFNTYVPIPDNIYCSALPISSLTDITISFLYPDGTIPNFRNANHSITLKITEEHVDNDTINLNSQNISFIDEYKKTYMNNNL